MVQAIAFLRLRTGAMHATSSTSQGTFMAVASASRFSPALPTHSASSSAIATFNATTISSSHRRSLPRFLTSTCRAFPSSSSYSRSIRSLSSFRRSTRVQPADSKPQAHQEDAGASIAAEKGDNGAAAAAEELQMPQKDRIVPVEFHKEITDSYIAYAVSVLVGRALPDVRDGLKPVHRRILYAMHEMDLSSRKPFRKSARVVGEVLGKFHPHGDSAVYDALVRMAQDFSLRTPLIRGHGNFGSLDADPPAAMRYTECRLEALSESMLLEDLKHDTVDFVPNFDGSQHEPTVLPARLPNLLLNGASGIAVTMATNIPPHNLGEVADVLCALIHNPNATIQELMEHLSGPDFPTGGQILGSFGVLEAYRTGRGVLTVRGLAQVEQLDRKSNKPAIVITQIPFQSNKAALVKRMADLVDGKTLEGISDIRDESDKSGMRIVVEVKRGANPLIVLNNLYKHTQLQVSFGCNMVGIFNGKPKLMGLKEILQAFLDFRCSVIERRSKCQLKQAEERDHVLEGILIALENLNDVVEIVRDADRSISASMALQQKFKLSEMQANAILNMTLRRLTHLERGKFVEEHRALGEEIFHLKHLLSNRRHILQVIETESLALKRDYATPRQTALLPDDSACLSDMDVVANDEVLVTLSKKGYIKRMKQDTFVAQSRGTVGKSSGKLKSDDSLSEFFSCRNHDHLLFFSEKGVVFSTRAFQIPECSKTASGTPLVQILSIPPGERITSVKSVSSFADDQYLVMLTAAGYIKRTSLSAFSGIRPQGIVAIQLVPGDELKWVRLAAEGDSVTICSQRGLVLHIHCGSQTLPAHGRQSRGMRAMRLKLRDSIAAMDIVPISVLQTLTQENVNAPWLLFVTEFGCGKRVQLRLFPLRRRNTVGLVGYKFREANDRLVSLFLVGSNISDDGETDEQVILGSQGGIANRLKVKDISIQGRSASGVILMRLEQGDKVNSVSVVSPSNLEENSSPEDVHLDAAEA